MKPISTSQALALLAETFDEPVERMAPATARDAIAGWDSMGALSLMANSTNGSTSSCRPRHHAPWRGSPMSWTCCACMVR